MSEYNYAFTGFKENMTRAVGINLPISTKQSVMVCQAIRGLHIEKAVKVLSDCIEHKKAIPYTRYNHDTGHKKEMAAGRYPEKAATEIRKIVQSAQTNGQFKGLSSANLKVIHVCAKQGSSTYRYGRQTRRQAKRSTVEVVLAEVAEREIKKRETKAPAKPAAETKAPAEAVKQPVAAAKQPAPAKPTASPSPKRSTEQKKSDVKPAPHADKKTPDKKKPEQKTEAPAAKPAAKPAAPPNSRREKMIERALVNQRVKEYEIQEYITNNLHHVGHSHTKVQRTPLGEKITIFASRPGLIVGRKGQNIKNLTQTLKNKFKLENPQIEISEVEQPDLDAQIVAERIANSLERFGPTQFKGVGHKTLEAIRRAGALGAEILISGKIPGARARVWRFYQGYLKKCGDIAITGVRNAIVAARLKSGTIGIKVSIMPPDTKLPDKVELVKELETVTEELGNEEAEKAFPDKEEKKVTSKEKKAESEKKEPDKKKAAPKKKKASTPAKTKKAKDE